MDANMALTCQKWTNFFVCLSFLYMHYFVSILVLQSSWRGRESWLLCQYCFRDVLLLYVLWLFLMVPRVGLLSVLVVFPDHTHLFYPYEWLLYIRVIWPSLPKTLTERAHEIVHSTTHFLWVEASMALVSQNMNRTSTWNCPLNNRFPMSGS